MQFREPLTIASPVGLVVGSGDPGLCCLCRTGHGEIDQSILVTFHDLAANLIENRDLQRVGRSFLDHNPAFAARAPVPGRFYVVFYQNHVQRHALRHIAVEPLKRVLERENLRVRHQIILFSSVDHPT